MDFFSPSPFPCFQIVNIQTFFALCDMCSLHSGGGSGYRNIGKTVFETLQAQVMPFLLQSVPDFLLARLRGREENLRFGMSKMTFAKSVMGKAGILLPLGRRGEMASNTLLFHLSHGWGVGTKGLSSDGVKRCGFMMIPLTAIVVLTHRAWRQQKLHLLLSMWQWASSKLRASVDRFSLRL